jgi:hypothetical protein
MPVFRPNTGRQKWKYVLTQAKKPGWSSGSSQDVWWLKIYLNCTKGALININNNKSVRMKHVALCQAVIDLSRLGI